MCEYACMQFDDWFKYVVTIFLGTYIGIHGYMNSPRTRPVSYLGPWPLGPLMVTLFCSTKEVTMHVGIIMEFMVITQKKLFNVAVQYFIVMGNLFIYSQVGCSYMDKY